MARSKITQKIEDLSEEREGLLAREGTHHAGAGDHRRLAEIDHALGVLWDLGRRELAGEQAGLEEDFLNRYVVSPGGRRPRRLHVGKVALSGERRSENKIRRIDGSSQGSEYG